MRPIPDRLTPLECWPVHMTRQDKKLLMWPFVRLPNLALEGNYTAVEGNYMDLEETTHTSYPPSLAPFPSDQAETLCHRA